MNLFQKIAVITTSAVLSYTAICVESAEAAIISYNFAVNGTSSGLLGSGSFDYDNSLTQTSSGYEFIGVSSLSFDFGGQKYTEKDDTKYPEFPKVEFLDGKLLGLNYLVGPSSDPANGFSLVNSNFSAYGAKFETGTVTYTLSAPKPVPEPGYSAEAWAILALGGFLLKSTTQSR